MDSQLNGSCLCGACDVIIRPAEDKMHACHCDMCRAWTGSSLIAVRAMPGDLETRGPVRTRATSAWAERGWCDECGSSLSCRVTAPGPYQGVAHVAAGLFPNAGGLTLASEIYVDRRPDGYAFAGELHGMTEAEVMAKLAEGAEA